MTSGINPIKNIITYSAINITFVLASIIWYGFNGSGNKYSLSFVKYRILILENMVWIIAKPNIINKIIPTNIVSWCIAISPSNKLYPKNIISPAKYKNNNP